MNPATVGRYRVALMIAIGAITAVIYVFAAPRSLGDRQTFDAPRDNVGYVLTSRFADGKGIGLPLLHHDELPPDIGDALTPWDAARVDGRAVPKDFVGTIVLYAALLWIWKPLALVVSPILAVLSAFLVAQCVAEIFAFSSGNQNPSWRRPTTDAEAWVGLGAFVLWLSYPGLIVSGSRIFAPDAPALVLFLLAAIAFLRYWRLGTTSDFVRMILWLGAAILFRYPMVIAAAGLMLSLLVTRKLTLKQVAMAAVLTAPFVGAIAAFNQALYGDFTSTGYHVTTRLRAATVNLSDSGIVRFRFDAAANHLRFYLLEKPMILAPQLLGIGFTLYTIRRSRRLRGPILSLAFGTGLYFVYHLGLDTWGSSQAAVNASFIRYMLPALALWTIFLCMSLYQVVPSRVVVIGMTGALMFAGIATAVNPFGGVLDRADSIARNQKLRSRVVALTEPEALILNRVSDWSIFPERQTVTLTYLIRNSAPVRKTASQLPWQFLPPSSRLSEVAGQILQTDIPLYLLQDFPPEVLEDYRRGLEGRGLVLEQVASETSDLPALFKIVGLAAAS